MRKERERDLASVKLDLAVGLFGVIDSIGAIDLRGDRLDLFLDGEIERIQKLEVGLKTRLLADLCHRSRKIQRSLSSLCPVVAEMGSFRITTSISCQHL